MRILGQKGLFDPLQKSQVALIVISVILVGLVECKEKVRIFYNKTSRFLKKISEYCGDTQYYGKLLKHIMDLLMDYTFLRI